MDFKVGDVVHVRARMVGLDTLPGCTFPVVEISCGDVDVADLEHHGFTNIYVPRVYVVHVEPRPLAVGDKIMNDNLVGIIEAISGDFAWVSGCRPQPITMHLKFCIRIG